MFNVIIKSYRPIIALLGLMCIVVGPACAQFASLENGYIGVAIGRPGNWEGPFGHVLISSDPPIGGRFQLWNTGGDPTNPIDDGMQINYSPLYPPMPGDKWGAWQVMVSTYANEEAEMPGEQVWAAFDPANGGGTSGIWGDTGDPGDGYFSQLPHVPTNENVIRGVWYPRPVGAYSPTQGELGEDQIVMPVIRCELEVRLMRDTARFKWTLTNEGFRHHMVGMRVYADLLPSAEHSGTQDLRNIISVPGFPLIDNPRVIHGNDIPSVLEMFDNREDPIMSIRMTFDGQGATKPDVVGVDDWGVVASPSWSYHSVPVGSGGDPFCSWTYEPIPYYSYINDVAYGAFWKPRRIAPQQTLTIIHYVGLGCATSDFTKPNMDHPQYVASVQGPRTLAYYRPENPSEGTGGRLDPNPFTISAYMSNTEKYIDFTNASFTLMLPPGLTLDESENGKYTKTVNRIRAMGEGSVSWQVRPVGSPTGIQKYAVSFSADPVGGTTVSREINIPATEIQPLSSGWQMVSVPFKLTNPDPDTSLGLFPGYSIWQYDTYLKQYVPVERLEPGTAYWLRLPQGQSTYITDECNPIQWAGTNGYTIPLKEGWNMVGNPFVYTMTLGEAKFYTRDYGVMDFDQAMNAKLISPTVFWWDPVFRKYNWSSNRSVQLKPWQGYWVKCLRPGVTMFLTPVSQIGARLGGRPGVDDEGLPVTPPPAPQ